MESWPGFASMTPEQQAQMLATAQQSSQQAQVQAQLQAQMQAQQALQQQWMMQQAMQQQQQQQQVAQQQLASPVPVPVPPPAHSPGPVTVPPVARHVAPPAGRQVVVPPVPPAVTAAGGALEKYTVKTTANDMEEIIIKTLVGEYTEHSINHGRKVFKKTSPPPPGTEAVEVFIYYWDSRDGPTFEGWWFGNQVGGSQVWSHAASSQMTPPVAGWKIPWDGPLRTTLVLEKVQTAVQTGPVTIAANPNMVRGREILQATQKAVEDATTPAKESLTQAAAMHANYTSLEGIKTAEALLGPRMQALGQAMKVVMDNQKIAPFEIRGTLAQLGNNLRLMQTQVSTEMGKLRMSKVKAENDKKMEELSVVDKKSFEAFFPECQEKANTAEDLVEKAAITNEMISAAADDLTEAKKAVEQTEAAVKLAQEAVASARFFINQKMGAVRLFKAPPFRESSVLALNKLNLLLTNAQNKLNPLKMAKQEFLQREMAEKMSAEVVALLTPAEIECDKAEEVGLSVAEQGTNKESMQQVDKAIAKATELIQKALRFINTKKNGATGAVLKEALNLEQRAKNCEKRMTTLKNSHKEAMDKLNWQNSFAEAQSKLKAVEEAVEKATAAEGPFCMGVEELPLDKTLTVVKACETAAAAAATVISIARMFIATKLVEARRYPQALSEEAVGKLKELQKSLDTNSKRHAEIKSNAASRKKTALLKEANKLVTETEAALAQYKEAAACFEDTQKLAKMAPEEIEKANAEAITAEKAASSKCIEARRYISARQIEAKGKDIPQEVSTELVKYNTKINGSMAEVTRLKRLVASFGDRLQAIKAVEEIGSQTLAVDAKVDAAIALVKKYEALQASGSAPAPATKVEEKEEQKEEKDEKMEGEEDNVKEEPKVEEAAAETAKEEITFEAVQAAVQESMEETQKVEQSIKDLIRQHPTSEQDVQKHSTTLSGAQAKLAGVQGLVKTWSEQAEVKQLLVEATSKVSEAETAAKTAVDAIDAEVPPEERTGEAALAAFEAHEKLERAALTAITSARTQVTMKRVAFKRMNESIAAEGLKELTALLERIDNANVAVQGLKAKLSAKKQELAKVALQVKLKEVLEKVKAASEVTDTMVEGGDVAANEMKEACERAGAAQGHARRCIEELKTMMLEKQREIRQLTGQSPEEVKAELVEITIEMETAQKDLHEQEKKLRDQEFRFVAQRLMQDAKKHQEGLEKQLEDTKLAAAPLLSEEGAAFIAYTWLNEVVGALKKHAASLGKSQEELFALISEGADTATEAKFIKYLQGMPEMKERGETLFSEEETKAIFATLDTEKKGEINQSQFLDPFQRKYYVVSNVSMTQALTVKGSAKPVRKMELNEILEALEDPQKDPTTGLMRVKVRADKDKKEGWVTLHGNQGTDFLVAFDPFAACEQTVQKAVQELWDTAVTAQRLVDKWTAELGAVDSPLLAECKDMLKNMKPRVEEVQTAQCELKRQLEWCKHAYQKRLDSEHERRQQLLDRRIVHQTLEDGEALSKAPLEEAKKALEECTAVEEASATDEATRKSIMHLLVCADKCEKANKALEEKMATFAQRTSDHWMEARKTLTAAGQDCVTACDSCRRKARELQAKVKVAEEEAHERILSGINAHLKSQKLLPTDWFKSLAGGEAKVPFQALQSAVEKLDGLELSPEQISTGLLRYREVDGLTRMTLLSQFQKYYRCIKEIAMTTAFAIKDGKPLRKLAVGEIVEILGEDTQDTEDTNSPMLRCNVRSLTDGLEGWATVKGNQGTIFLVAHTKPMYLLNSEVHAHPDFEGTQPSTGRISSGSLVELLEGPRNGAPRQVQRAQFKVQQGSNETKGWLALEDGSGVTLMEKAKIHICRQVIAVTPELNIKQGKSSRKLSIGEMVEVLNEPQDYNGLPRVQVRAKLDGLEGWVTVKGNQGTSFIEASDNFYICSRPQPLEEESGRVRAMSNINEVHAGDLVELVAGPQTETRPGVSTMRGRCLQTGIEGWFAASETVASLWVPHYVCRERTDLQTSLEASSSKLRELMVNEELMALSVPEKEATVGVTRVHVRADHDGQMGYATVQDTRGATLLSVQGRRRW